MVDRPILFSGPMVRAILEGRNTQTRRVLKPQPSTGSRFTGIHYASYEPETWFFNSPRGPFKARITHDVGDRLWVREAWRAPLNYDKTKPRNIPQTAVIVPEANAAVCLGGKLRPGMFMPRWASRLTLIVTDVRVQRLQEISEADAEAEGACPEFEIDVATFVRGTFDAVNASTYRLGFKHLWDSIAKPGATWADNPWVVAITFEPRHRNIDAMEQADA